MFLHGTCWCKLCNLSNGELFLLTHSFLTINTSSDMFLRNEGNFVIQIMVSQVHNSFNQPILFFSKRSQRIRFLLSSCTYSRPWPGCTYSKYFFYNYPGERMYFTVSPFAELAEQQQQHPNHPCSTTDLDFLD